MGICRITSKSSEGRSMVEVIRWANSSVKSSSGQLSGIHGPFFGIPFYGTDVLLADQRTDSTPSLWFEIYASNATKLCVKTRHDSPCHGSLWYVPWAGGAEPCLTCLSFFTQ